MLLPERTDFEGGGVRPVGEGHCVVTLFEAIKKTIWAVSVPQETCDACDFEKTVTDSSEIHATPCGVLSFRRKGNDRALFAVETVDGVVYGLVVSGGSKTTHAFITDTLEDGVTNVYVVEMKMARDISAGDVSVVELGACNIEGVCKVMAAEPRGVAVEVVPTSCSRALPYAVVDRQTVENCSYELLYGVPFAMLEERASPHSPFTYARMNEDDRVELYRELFVSCKGVESKKRKVVTCFRPYESLLFDTVARAVHFGREKRRATVVVARSLHTERDVAEMRSFLGRRNGGFDYQLVV